jgi:hypothetical protein
MNTIAVGRFMKREVIMVLPPHLIGGSLCSYRNLEDKVRHTLYLLPIGPKGGAAPLVFDGRPVAYEFYVHQSKTGKQQ